MSLFWPLDARREAVLVFVPLPETLASLVAEYAYQFACALDKSYALPTLRSLVRVRALLAHDDGCVSLVWEDEKMVPELYMCYWKDGKAPSELHLATFTRRQRSVRVAEPFLLVEEDKLFVREAEWHFVHELPPGLCLLCALDANRVLLRCDEDRTLLVLDVRNGQTRVALQNAPVTYGETVTLSTDCVAGFDSDRPWSADLATHTWQHLKGPLGSWLTGHLARDGLLLLWDPYCNQLTLCANWPSCTDVECWELGWLEGRLVVNAALSAPKHVVQILSAYALPSGELFLYFGLAYDRFRMRTSRGFAIVDRQRNVLQSRADGDWLACALRVDGTVLVATRHTLFFLR